MRYFTNILLNTEEKARRFFEKIPFTHAFLAGVGVILFWRGVWEVADIMGVTPVTSIVIGSLLLGVIGLFLQTFVGNAIIIKTVEKEKKTELRTEKEIKDEEVTLEHLAKKLEAIEEKLNSITR